MQEITCFKAYDIRGRIPDQLNEDIAYRIGRVFADYLSSVSVVVGYDIRLTSKDLCNALSMGLMEGGAIVVNIGECGTEEVYFATAHLKATGGIMVTASHNPKDYNGMKLVREEAKPISNDTGLDDIKILTEAAQFRESKRRGTVLARDSSPNLPYYWFSRIIRPAYIRHLLGYVNQAALKPLKIVCNAGNGGAGAIIDLLEPHLPFEFIKLHHEPDGNFPNGVPNPLLPENRQPTIDAINEHGADMGIAWDGDFDRCFFFDASGRFIEGYYIVGLLAQAFLEREPGAKIVHDPRLTWNTIEVVNAHGGKPVQCKTGHAFIKERMRAEDAIYGGEMSAHHYFRDFFYCDSGMIPWLLVAELMTKQGRTLAELVDERIAAFPASGEINSTVKDPAALLAAVESHYASQAQAVDHTDGLSMNMGDWRFNLRLSNTEPVVRANVEARASAANASDTTPASADAKDRAKARMQEKTEELLGLIRSLS